MPKNQIIKCLAAVAWEVGRPLNIEEIEVDPPRTGEVRIKIVATGICHTDIAFLNGLDPAFKFPVILGHEGSGIVESVGPGVTSFKEGDHVIPLNLPNCDQCKNCKNPKTNLCEKFKLTAWGALKKDGTTRFRCKGKDVYHFQTSTFSQYTVLDQLYVVKIPKEAPLEKVCLIGCGISTGYGSAVNTAKVEAGSTCAVWGLGGVGLAVAMGCRDRGASRIIGIDINPYKFEHGKKFGITEFVNPKDHNEPIQQVISKMTDGGCDYTFECIGTVGTIRAALDACANWGECILIGATKLHEEISAKTFDLLHGKTMKGSIIGGYKLKYTIPKMVEDYMNGKLMIDEFITHTVKLQDINGGVDLLNQGKCIRTVVNLF